MTINVVALISSALQLILIPMAISYFQRCQKRRDERAKKAFMR